MAAQAKDQDYSIPSNCGRPIPSWSHTAQEYEALQHFPELGRRFETGPHCLTLKERFELLELADGLKVPATPPLHEKVSLVAGGNLAHMEVDAVVNASNNWLTTGKGVNGAIHSGAGECLLEECLRIGRCEVGEAKLTSGYNLLARQVIHTVGPEGKDENREERLRSCYRSCLELCLKNNLKTIAFPCISTGQYCYPSVEAANVACSTVREWLLKNSGSGMERIIFVTRNTRDEEAYSTLMMKYFPTVQ